MPRTPEEQAAYLAEKKRVDDFYNKGLEQQAAYQKSQKKPLTPLEIKEQQAALLRQQLMQQYATQPVSSGLQRLLDILTGRQQQKPPQQQQPPRR